MNSRAEEAPYHDATRGQTQEDPFAALAMLRRRLHEQGQHTTIDGSRMAQLLASTAVLAEISAWATEMQLGADGFDNTTASRRYAEVQARLLNAGREIQAACETLAEGLSG